MIHKRCQEDQLWRGFLIERTAQLFFFILSEQADSAITVCFAANGKTHLFKYILSG